MKMSAKAFDRAVARAVDRIPAEIRDLMDNVVVAVRKRPTQEMLEATGMTATEPPLGLYWGESLLDRSSFSPVQYPDTIFIFQEPLEEMCGTLAELEREIEITVVHEVAHFLGIDEERLTELGYA